MDVRALSFACYAVPCGKLMHVRGAGEWRKGHSERETEKWKDRAKSVHVDLSRVLRVTVAEDSQPLRSFLTHAGFSTLGESTIFCVTQRANRPSASFNQRPHILFATYTSSAKLSDPGSA